MIAEYLQNTLALILDAAPWLLLGLLAAGLIKAWIPEDLIQRWMGGSGLWATTKAALIGAPLPLCSCGVMPAALGLHRAGASRSSTLSFMIATPETGVDSVAVSYALLGPFMTIIRPIAAVLSAVFTGLLVALLPPSVPSAPAAPQPSACGCDSSCASTPAPSPSPGPGPGRSLRQGLRYALVDILDDIALWMGVGLLLAGVISTAVPPQALAAWGSGLPAMGLMLVIGIPMYICATASTPLAAAFLLAGLSPGTVLVFLLAGPATNIATLGVLRKEMGPAVLAVYLLGIALSSLGLGLLTDRLAAGVALNVPAQLAEGAELIPAWIGWASALLLMIFAIRPLRRVILGRWGA